MKLTQVRLKGVRRNESHVLLPDEKDGVFGTGLVHLAHLGDQPTRFDIWNHLPGGPNDMPSEVLEFFTPRDEDRSPAPRYFLCWPLLRNANTITPIFSFPLSVDSSGRFVVDAAPLWIVNPEIDSSAYTQIHQAVADTFTIDQVTGAPAAEPTVSTSPDDSVAQAAETISSWLRAKANLVVPAGKLLLAAGNLAAAAEPFAVVAAAVGLVEHGRDLLERLRTKPDGDTSPSDDSTEPELPVEVEEATRVLLSRTDRTSVLLENIRSNVANGDSLENSPLDVLNQVALAVTCSADSLGPVIEEYDGSYGLIARQALLDHTIALLPEGGEPVQMGRSFHPVMLSHLNDDQTAALESAFTNPITVVQGPPGSGKSELITSVVATAWENRQTVAIASSTNAAVEAVAGKVDKYLTKAVEKGWISRDHAAVALLRSGDRATRDAVTERINTVVRNGATSSVSHPDVESARAARERAVSDIELELSAVLRDSLHVATMIPPLDEQGTDPADGARLVRRIHRQLLQRTGSKKHSRTELLEDARIVQVLNDLSAACSTDRDRSILEDLFHTGIPTSAWGVWRFRQRHGLTLRQYMYFAHLLDRAMSIVVRQPALNTWLKAANHVAEGAVRRIDDLLDAIPATDAELATVWRILEFPERTLHLSLFDEYRRVINAECSAGLQAFAFRIAEAVRLLRTVGGPGADSPAWWWHQVLGRKGPYGHTEMPLRAWASTLHGVSKTFPNDMFGRPDDRIDLVVIDEATLVSYFLALPLLARAKRILIIGDPEQLNPVHTFPPAVEELIAGDLFEELDRGGYRFGAGSLYQLAARKVGTDNVIVLRDHYRCPPDVIALSQPTYGNKIRVRKLTGEPRSMPAISWDPLPRGASLEHQVSQAADLVERLLGNGVEKHDIGVVTPFRAFAAQVCAELNKNQTDPEIASSDSREAKENELVLVSTVHSFQGSERGHIIFCPSVVESDSRGRQDWALKDDAMLNVAFTRTVTALHIAGDLDLALEVESRIRPEGWLVRAKRIAGAQKPTGTWVFASDGGVERHLHYDEDLGGWAYRLPTPQPGESGWVGTQSALLRWALGPHFESSDTPLIPIAGIRYPHLRAVSPAQADTSRVPAPPRCPSGSPPIPMRYPDQSGSWEPPGFPPPSR